MYILQRRYFIMSITFLMVISISTLLNQAQSCDTSLSPDDYKIQGDEQLSAGNYSDAVASFSCVVELDPEFSSAYINRGVAYYYLGDYEGAIDDYSQAIEVNDQEVNAWNNRGWVYIQLRQPEDAIADFMQVFELVDEPGSDTLYGIADAYYQLADLDNALLYWNQFLELADDPTIRERVNYIEAQLSVADEVCDLSLSIEDYTKTTLDFIQQDMIIEAFQEAHCALLIAPDAPIAYSNRAALLVAMDNYTSALQDYETTLSLDPDYLNALTGRASVYREYGRYEEAVYDLIKSVILGNRFAGDIESINQLGFSWMRLGDFENSFLAYERLVISLGKDELPQGILDNIAFVEQTVDKQVAESLTCLGEEHTGDVKLWANSYAMKAGSARFAGDFELALDNMNCAVEWLPFSYVHWNDRAFILIQLEDYESASESIGTSLVYNPQYAPAYANLGLLHYRQDNFDEGLEAVNRALELDPENDRALVTRADIYYDLEQFDEALVDYKEAQRVTAEFIGRLPDYVQERVDELSQ